MKSGKISIIVIMLFNTLLLGVQDPIRNIYNSSNSGLSHNDTWHISIDLSNNKWVCTDNGLCKFDGTNWTVYNTSNSSLPSNVVKYICTDASGVHWIGTGGGGLAKFDGTNWTIYNTSNSGLPNNIVNNIKIDASGNKWISTFGGGIAKYNGTTWVVYNTSNSGLPDNNTNPLFIDNSNNIWVGTVAGGLAKFNGASWTVYNSSNSGLPNNNIPSIYVENSGIIWAGTYGSGLVKFDGSTWTIYNKSNSSLPANEVMTINADIINNKWIGTYSALVRFDGVNWDIYKYGFSYLEVRSIAFDSDNNKWIATWYNGIIYAQSSLSISSPLGNESWQTGTLHNITWNGMLDGNIKIEITTNNGTNWLTLQNSVPSTPGNYNFTIPPFSTSTQCRIRLTSLSHANISTSGLFTITTESVPNLTITYPNLSTSLNSDASETITWQVTGTVQNVKLEYTTDDGENWHEIIAQIPSANLSYLWTVPNIGSNSCRVRISDVLNSVLNDVSDNLFSIRGINIVTPVGGDKWKSGTSQNISWTSSGISTINILYFNGSSWVSITTVPAGNGSYNWTVPEIALSNCRIQIQDASKPSLQSTSNIFTLWYPITSNNTPSLGQVSLTFGSTNLTFSAFVLASGQITITYYPFESPSSGTLPSGVNSVNSYFWTISANPSLSFFNGSVEVPLSSLTDVSDPNKLVWLKRSNSGGAWLNIGGVVENEKIKSGVLFDSFSEFTLGNSDNPWPVELSSFNASIKENKSVKISWKTETETNNFGFEVERKLSGKFEWTKIGFVEGHGTSNSPKQYSFTDEGLLTIGTYHYRLKQIDNDGTFKYSQEVAVEFNNLPDKFALSQNYPNPFNPSTVINYQLPVNSYVTLKVFDIIGNEVATLVNQEKPAGSYEVTFDASNLTSGVYFYELYAGDFRSIKKLMLVK
ncbi:MAG: two-component regulator propeller domain-containing protein [Ignavibacteriaceae bacterium]|nr:two-component regulator propeller domain-containing protein [Ignavibacteriaceae bacterium]